MTSQPRRTPTGAALLQPKVTDAITEAVFVELAENGYGRLAMEAVAKRAGVGKSALYRRWSCKQDMVIAAITAFSVPRVPSPNTGSLAEDLRILIGAVHEWLTHPLFARILPDLVAEAARTPALAEAAHRAVGEPRRAMALPPLHRAMERGELPPDLNLEMAVDLLAAPIYWRISVRGATEEPGYLDSLTEFVVRALGARQ